MVIQGAMSTPTIIPDYGHVIPGSAIFDLNLIVQSTPVPENPAFPTSKLLSQSNPIQAIETRVSILVEGHAF